MSTAPQPGKFITFEGLDGSGKSTQLEKLAQALRLRRIDLVTTREPGGTVIGERIRALLLDSRTRGLANHTELAMMVASRAQLVGEIILPELRAGRWVLCDRFVDSTEAYQGAGRQLGIETVRQLHRLLCRDLWPDLTILMDTDFIASVQRARLRNRFGGPGHDENRFERESQEFFSRVHQSFLEIARREPQRMVVIDARPPIEVVHDEIMRVVIERLITSEQTSRQAQV
ncbi:MAG TPA: dTMP kinase [Bryocella sp.]|nr:dTMP kinase [Bryocella sp.]